MNQQHRKSKIPPDKTAEKSGDKRFEWLHGIKWKTEFWSEHPEAIILLFIIPFLLGPIGDFMTKQAKVWSIGAGIWLICLLAIVFVCKSITHTMASQDKRGTGADSRPTPADPQSFLVTRETLIVTPAAYANDTSLYFLYGLSDNKQYVSPLDTGMYLRLTNQSQNTMMIDSCSFERKLSDGSWQTFPVIPKCNVYRGGLSQCRKVNIETENDFAFSVIGKKNFAAGETASGWIFCCLGCDASTFEFRVLIQDVAGVRYLTPLRPITSSLATKGLIHFPIADPPFDFSKYPVRPWSPTDYPYDLSSPKQ